MLTKILFQEIDYMNIYVGNISFKTTESSLRDYFSALGSVSDVKLITDRETGRARGFGFVTMSNDEEANRAIAELNGIEFEGRPLVVNQARERQSRY